MNKILWVITLCACSQLSQAQVHNEVQGIRAGDNITTGDYNVIYGDASGGTIDSESQNVIVGYRACVGELDVNNDLGDGSAAEITLQDCDVERSVIIGYHANQQGTGGTNNVIIGSEAGGFNRSSSITFVGARAGYNNTTGGDNIFIGEDAGYSNITASDNVFVGANAGILSMTGGGNTALGNDAFISNQAGHL